MLEDNGVKSECVVTDEGNGVLEISELKPLVDNAQTDPEYNIPLRLTFGVIYDIIASTQNRRITQ